MNTVRVCGHSFNILLIKLCIFFFFKRKTVLNDFKIDKYLLLNLHLDPVTKDDIIPVSIRLKTNIRTVRGLEIIRKAERKLLNERVRFINNSLELYTYERDSIVQQLEEKLEQDQSNYLKSVRISSRELLNADIIE